MSIYELVENFTGYQNMESFLQEPAYLLMMYLIYPVQKQGIQQCIVEKILFTETQYHKLLKTLFDAVRCALSNETTLKILGRADLTKLQYTRDLSSKNGIEHRPRKIRPRVTFDTIKR